MKCQILFSLKNENVPKGMDAVSGEGTVKIVSSPSEKGLLERVRICSPWKLILS